MRNRISKKYMRAVGQLYGTQLDLEGKESKPKSVKTKPKSVCPTEQQEQFVAHAWMVKMNIIHNHSPNGGYRDYIEAAKFKRMGVSPGFPDFEIPYPRNGYHGLYIELKRLSGGRLSEHQIWWKEFLQRQGYAWFEARGATECIEIVTNYLGLSKGATCERI